MKPCWSRSNPQVLIFCENKNEPFFQSAISLDPNSEFKILLQYACWFRLAAHVMKYLSVLSSFTVKTFKNNTITYIRQTLCEFSIFHVLFFSINLSCLIKVFTHLLKH